MRRYNEISLKYQINTLEEDLYLFTDLILILLSFLINLIHKTIDILVGINFNNFNAAKSKLSQLNIGLIKLYMHIINNNIIFLFTE